VLVDGRQDLFGRLHGGAGELASGCGSLRFRLRRSGGGQLGRGRRGRLDRASDRLTDAPVLIFNLGSML
jgi:hypothetical protein